MSSRVRLGSIAVCVAWLGCDASRQPAPAAPPVPAPSGPTARDDASAHADDNARSAETAEAGAAPQRDEAQPEPAVAPPAKLPDGTVIEPCAEPPEAMACVEGGAFIRGSDDGPKNAHPSATVWLQTFYMDTHEVTYTQYKTCQKAGDCPRSGPRYTDFDHPNMPIQGISWFDAKAYCEAHGKSLPTEAQWEKAARGTEGALYPWGDEAVTCEHAIIKDERGRSCGLKKAVSKPEVGRPWDVGSRPPGIYGLHDMVGNSWEWVADWYSRSYEHCGEACEGIDPKGPCDGAETCPGHGFKIVRGGSWYWDATRATAIFRRPHHANNRPFHHFGFRCAATVDQAAKLR